MACVEGGRSDTDEAAGRDDGQVAGNPGTGPGRAQVGAPGTQENKRCPGRNESAFGPCYVKMERAGWEGVDFTE